MYVYAGKCVQGIAWRGQWCVAVARGCVPNAQRLQPCEHNVATNERGLLAAFGCEHCQRWLGKVLKKHLSVVLASGRHNTFS